MELNTSTRQVILDRLEALCVNVQLGPDMSLFDALADLTLVRESLFTESELISGKAAEGE